MNKIILIGNLTKDPELTSTNSGVSVCKFGLAVSRKFSNADGEKETDFFNMVAWRNTADLVAKYLKKGNKCGIVGNVQNRSYEAQDGTRKYITEIVVDEVEFLNSKTTTDETAPEPKEERKPLIPITDEDLPF